MNSIFLENDVRKVANTTLNCLGYGFVGRNEFIDNHIKKYNTEEKIVAMIVYMYARDNKFISFKNSKVVYDGCSKKILKLLTNKILESRDDLSIFVDWLSKYQKEIK